MLYPKLRKTAHPAHLTTTPHLTTAGFQSFTTTAHFIVGVLEAHRPGRFSKVTVLICLLCKVTIRLTLEIVWAQKRWRPAATPPFTFCFKMFFF